MLWCIPGARLPWSILGEPLIEFAPGFGDPANAIYDLRVAPAEAGERSAVQHIDLAFGFGDDIVPMAAALKQRHLAKDVAGLQRGLLAAAKVDDRLAARKQKHPSPASPTRTMGTPGRKVRV